MRIRTGGQFAAAAIPVPSIVPAVRSTRTAALVSLLALLGALLPATAALALPAGRSWSPIDTLNAHGHDYMFTCRFEPTIRETLRFVAIGIGGPGKFLTGFEWADTAWRVRWTHDDGAFITYESEDTSDREWLVWRSFQAPPGSAFTLEFMLVSTVSGDSLATPDTVGVVYESANHYDAAASDSCEWVVVWDPVRSNQTRSFTRRRPDGPWLERRLPISGNRGYATVALDDTTALVVGGADSLRWGRLTPTRWLHGGALYTSAFPSPLRSDGAGGWWLGWTEDWWPAVMTRWLPGGGWAPLETLAVHYPPSLYQVAKNNDLSRDRFPRPAMVWSSFGDNGVEHLYLAWPNDSAGWYPAEQVPGTAKGIAPQVARDENGDVWLMWLDLLRLQLSWRHSHTHAVTDTPRAGEDRGRPRLRWNLSEPAPGSYWTIWRATGAGDFEQVARLAAGSAAAMEFVDAAPPAGVALRYRVRRECKDVRYRWTSAEAEWLPRTARLRLALRSPNPVGGALAVEVLGAAAGALELQLFDLQGRLVARARATASGSGRDAVSLDPATGARPLRSGVYVLRARGGDRRTSDGLKVVVLR